MFNQIMAIIWVILFVFRMAQEISAYRSGMDDDVMNSGIWGIVSLQFALYFASRV